MKAHIPERGIALLPPWKDSLRESSIYSYNFKDQNLTKCVFQDLEQF